MRLRRQIHHPARDWHLDPPYTECQWLISACQIHLSVEFCAAFPSEALMAYAIITTGGRQYRVTEGDTIDVDLLDVEAGKTATFSDVLMYSDSEKLTHGDPLISGAKVTAEVVEQRKDKKVIAFKFKRRKGYHRTVGHRRKLTRVKIKSISVGPKKAAAAKKTSE
jgi:large subunit ribosomal protein L21